jgi:tight adherence protein C
MMDALQDFQATIEGLLGPAGPVLLLGLLGVLLVLLALPALLQRPRDPFARLNAEVRGAAPEAQLRRAEGTDTLERYRSFLEPQDAEELSAIRLKLLQAGYRSKGAVRMFHFAQMALGLLALGAGVTYTLATAEAGGTGAKDLVLQTILPGAIGYMAPKYWVNKRLKARQEAITNGFPDSLDLMLVCVEAGQSLDQSILRVARELRAGFPELAEEFEQVNHEMKAGKDKAQVLRDMSERCGVQDVTAFVTVLIQSQQFGTSIAEALRVYAAEMRDKRVMRAEEKANTLPTKLTLATMMLTVPPLLIILIGPSVFDIYMTLGGGAQAASTTD